MHALEHVGITVTDLDASIAFYTEVVGMTFLRRGFKTGGDWFDTLTGASGAIIDAARVGFDDFSLQLVVYQEGAGGRAETGHNKVGNVHLCITVPDVDAKRAELTRVDREGGPIEATAIVNVAGGHARSFYISDPDGIPIEFITP